MQRHSTSETSSTLWGAAVSRCCSTCQSTQVKHKRMRHILCDDMMLQHFCKYTLCCFKSNMWSQYIMWLILESPNGDKAASMSASMKATEGIVACAEMMSWRRSRPLWSWQAEHNWVPAARCHGSCRQGSSTTPELGTKHLLDEHHWSMGTAVSRVAARQLAAVQTEWSPASTTCHTFTHCMFQSHIVLHVLATL